MGVPAINIQALTNGLRIIVAAPDERSCIRLAQHVLAINVEFGAIDLPAQGTLPALAQTLDHLFLRDDEIKDERLRHASFAQQSVQKERLIHGSRISVQN